MAAGISLSMGLQGQEISASPKRQARLWNLPSLLFIGYQPVVVSSGLKRWGREIGHLVSKNEWHCISNSPYVYKSLHSDFFIFIFLGHMLLSTKD
jgi:hypothetical protein